MAGYDWGNGKSNNAVEAERNGLMVASKFAKWLAARGRRYRGCTAADVVAVMRPAEWHHSSKFFNRVNYYNPLELAYEDVRTDFAQRIAQRKQIDRLLEKCRQAGLAHVLFREGDVDGAGGTGEIAEWYPLPKRTADIGVDQRTIDRLARSLELHAERQAVLA